MDERAVTADRRETRETRLDPLVRPCASRMINDALRDALRALYAPTPTTDIDALNRSLLDAQASDEAWTWLDALLSSDVRRSLRHRER